MTDSDSETTQNDTDKGDWSGGLVAAGAGLIVGVLGAVGVAGDLLARMVRNNAALAALPLMIILLTAAVIAHQRVMASGRATWFRRFVAVIVPIVLVFQVGLGAASQLQRENPAITLAFHSSDGQLFVTATANGSGLSSKQRMLLQLVAITDADLLTNPSERPGVFGSAREECTTPYGNAKVPSGVEVLAWLETGPDGAGKAQTDTAVPVRDDALAYCAYVALIEPTNWFQALLNDGGQHNWALLEAAR